MTKTQVLTDALILLGYKDVTGGSEHGVYRRFKCKHVDDLYLFVKPDGRMRQGRTFEKSRPVSEINKCAFIQKAKYIKMGQPC